MTNDLLNIVHVNGILFNLFSFLLITFNISIVYLVHAILFIITEDDINEIKQDVSSFRFELLEILSNNGMTIPDYDRKIAKNTTGSKRRKSRAKARNHLAALPTFGQTLTYTVLDNKGKQEPEIKITNVYEHKKLSPVSSMGGDLENAAGIILRDERNSLRVSSRPLSQRHSGLSMSNGGVNLVHYKEPEIIHDYRKGHQHEQKSQKSVSIIT